MQLLSVILPSLNLCISFTCLLSKRMKLRFLLPLFFSMAFLNLIFPYTGQWITCFIVFNAVISVYFGCGRQLLEVVFSLCGYLMLILVDHVLSIPLTYLGYSIPYIREYCGIPVAAIELLSIFVLLKFIRRRFILPRIAVFKACPTKPLLYVLASLFISISLLVLNFIYGEYAGYPSAVLSWNGFVISVLSLSILLVFYNMYLVLKRNQELSLREAQAKIMEDYAHRMDSFYKELRVFRHDYRNILSTLQCYIDEGDLNGLRHYYHTQLLPSAEILSNDGFQLGKLQLIHNTAVKGLLYTKITSILNQKLCFELELSEPVDKIAMDSLPLCRVLGILIDNAVEAAQASPEKRLCIAVLKENAATVFLLSNSTLPLTVPVSRLTSSGYSTKPGHPGLGLTFVQQLLESLPNVFLSTECENTLFRQTLIIADSAPA